MRDRLERILRLNLVTVNKVEEGKLTHSGRIESLCEMFCRSDDHSDMILESLLRKKINELELPQKLNQFSEVEILALQKIALNDIHEWAPYKSDFSFIEKQKPEIWKWLIISLASTALNKRRETYLKELGNGDLRWVDDPISIIEKDYQFAVSRVSRMAQSEPRGKIKYPDTSSEWWKPMTKSDMVWATGTYPKKIRDFLDQIKAKPRNEAKGKRGAYFSASTNLLVLDKWLSDWVEPKLASEYAKQISIFLDQADNAIALQEWEKLGVPEKFLPHNQAKMLSNKLPHIASFRKILSKFQISDST